jgi:hypothetical protein
VSPSAAQLAVGSSLTVVPTVNRANASVNVVYTYTSSTAAVATVSATGTVTAVAPGTTTITVTAAGTGTGFAAATMTSAATITVSDRAPGLTSLQVSPTTAALTVGGTQSVTASAQGPRASAATITYGTSAPAIATVSTTGVITAVAAGTATITVTAQSTQDGAFAASSMTGLVTVTVSNPAVVSINIAALTQGPTTTSYGSDGSSSGIYTYPNDQVGQAIDINNTRDQIQLTATLVTNGARVDSVVAYVANADGTGRTSVGSQSYPSGGSSGSVSLYINTADFTADFTAGTAAVKFTNGQKKISVSAFSGTTERASTNSQTVNFNNVDGYAASATAPAKSATNSAGQVWFGGPDSLTTRLGSATIVPVFYTAGRTLNSITLAMRQGVYGETQACAEYLVFQTGPYKFVYGGARAVFNDSTVVDCSALESAADHVVGVSAATDNNGSAAPTTSWAGGFRRSITVPAPVARKLDYVAPTAVAIDRKPELPADTSATWLNSSYSFTLATAPTTDLGVGMPGTTDAQRKANRQWSYLGCGVGSSTTPAVYVDFDGTTANIIECTSNATSTAYTARYTDADMLGNRSAAVTGTFGIDNTAPVITWTGTAAADSIDASNAFAAMTIIPNVFDAKTNLDSANVVGYVAKFGAAYASTGSTGVRTNWRGCYNLHDGSAFATSGNTAASASLTCTAEAYRAAVAGTVAGTVKPLATVSTEAQANVNVFVRVYDDAGNMAESSRRAMHDNLPPTITAGLNSALVAASNPTINGTFRDHRMGTAFLTVNYGANKFRYAPSTLGTAFGSSYTPSLATPQVGSTAATAAAIAFTLTPPTATPFVLGVGSGASGVLYTVLSQVGIIATDAARNAAAEVADAVQPASVPTLTTPTSTTTAGTFTVLTSLNAAGGAAAGPKAQLTGAALTTPSSTYSRVDFYRENGANTYDYIGSSSTPVTSGAAGENPVYTWALTSYAATNPQGTATRAVAISDVILALGVKSTGAADMSSATTIGGAAVRFTVAGLPVGTTANFTVTGPSSFSQTVSSGNATVTLGVPAQGVYTVMPTTTTTAAGVLYTSNNVAGLSATVVGNSAFNAGTFTYGANLIQASVTVGGLPPGSTTTLTFTQAGQATVTASAISGITNTVTLPAEGTWAVSATSSITLNRLAYTASVLAPVNVSVGASATNAGTITYSNTTYYIPVTVTSPDLATLTPSITSVGGTASGTAVVGTTNYTYGTSAPTTTSVLTANAVTVDGITYGPLTASTNALTPTLNGSATASFAYHRARLRVQFIGADLADLAGYTAQVALSGPNGALTPVALPIGSTASSAILVPVAGAYTAAAIPNIVIGNATYSFSITQASAIYGPNPTTVTIGVSKTVLAAPFTGTLSGTASATNGWTNATVATTRTVTPGGLTYNVGTTGRVWTCIAVTAAGGSTVSQLVTTSVNQSTGVCTVTGASTVTGAPVPVFVRLGLTAFGATVAQASTDVEVQFDRTADASVSGTPSANFAGSATVNNNAGSATRTLAISGLTITAGATAQYTCSSSNTALATVAVDPSNGVCTITRAGTANTATNVTIILSVTTSGTGLTTATPNGVVQVISREPDPAAFTGTLNATRSAVAAWTNADAGVTRTVTPSGLTLNAGANSTVWTCIAVTAAGGSTVSPLLATQVNQSTGVCTVSGTGTVVGPDVPVFVRLGVTSSGPTVTQASQTVEVQFDRAANPLAFTGVAAALNGGAAIMLDADQAATRTLEINGVTFAAGVNTTYTCSTGDATLASVTVNQATGVCTITREGTDPNAPTGIVITLTVTSSGNGLQARTETVTRTITRG